jgi:hypothetical protein
VVGIAAPEKGRSNNDPGLRTFNPKLETRTFCYKFGLNRLSRSELLTTDTELMAMAAEAIMGFRRIPQKG